MRSFIVVNAIIVLCGGVLTGMSPQDVFWTWLISCTYAGILSACELLEQLTLDRMIPKSFSRTMPVTNSPYISVISFIAFSAAIYASTGAQLSIVSKMCTTVHQLSIQMEELNSVLSFLGSHSYGWLSCPCFLLPFSCSNSIEDVSWEHLTLHFGWFYLL